MKHVITAQQFDRPKVDYVLELAEDMRSRLSNPRLRQRLIKRHQGMVAATLFFEPSTRTRLSFESAAQKLGLKLISTENARENSSVKKSETIEDTIRTVAAYADIVIMRHHETGAAARAAAVSSVPIINAGDGKGEHPTQALLDLYTINNEQGRLNGLNIVIGGDLAHGRTARSLAQMLALYPDNTLTFVSVPELQMGQDVLDYLDAKGTAHSAADSLDSSLADVDVVYWTRLQKERIDIPGLESSFVIDENVLAKMPDAAMVMHPLPRVDEITRSVDDDPRAAYFRQVQNGLYVRMALIDMLLAG